LSRRKRILYLYIFDSSFIDSDLSLLRKHYDVRAIAFGPAKKNKLKLPGLVLKLFAGVIWCDATFSWFADAHAYAAVKLSKLLRRKSIVVVGGYEVAKVPEIHYGKAYDPKGAKRVGYILRKADRVLMVDDSLRDDAKTNYGIEGENIVVVPTGQDHSKFKPAGQKDNSVLTVGYVGFRGAEDPRRKGLGLFLETARIMPETEFTIVGVASEEMLVDLVGTIPINAKLVKPVSHDQLVQYYQRAKVYCQLSIHEGLPTSVCEAMLCECIPVGTRRYGVATAIGDAGFLLDNPSPKDVADAIKKAFKCKSGEKARQRMINGFSMEAREKNLTGIIESLI